MSEHYLITGCAGFIGSNILEELIKQGKKITGIDNLSTGRLENIREFENKFNFIEGDLTQINDCKKACQGITHIIHLAALPSVPRSIEKPINTLNAGLNATINLFEAAREKNIKKIIQASSSSVYGDNKDSPKKENLKLRPLSPYAATKASQELFALAYAKSMHLEVISLRYFNVFGPRQNPESEYSAVIPKFIKLMIQNKQPVIYGDGEQERDFTYIHNVISANLLAIKNKHYLGGEVFNIACGESISLNQLVKKINSILEKNIKPKYTKTRNGDIKNSLASLEKSKKILKYQPEIKFDKGLSNTVEYYLKKYR